MIIKWSELPKWKKPHYERELRTAELIKLCYKYQFKEKKITPEKIHSLCQLTWWTEKIQYKLPSIWIIWGKHGKAPDWYELNKLASFGIPPSVLQLINGDTGFVNFYKAYRNSSLIWIKRHFKTVSALIHRAANLKDDKEAEDLIVEIDALPNIPMANRQPFEISPTSLLTPLLACLDPRMRFPIINKNSDVIELHKRLRITHNSLLNQFKTLIRLIGQYGIKNTFMLDVFSDKLSRKITPTPPTGTIEKPPSPKPGGKPLDQKDDKDVVIISNGYTGKARRIHNSMTNKLRYLCRRYHLQIQEGAGRKNKFDALILNYNNKGNDLLIEAKGSVSRSDLRLALGQLYDYRRGRKRRAATDLAVLLPGKPKRDDIDFLRDACINVIWFVNSKLQKLAGNVDAPFINTVD